MMDTPPPQALDAASEVESVRKIVEKHFKVYETKLNADTISFHCDVDKLTLDEKFRALRAEVGAMGYTPVVTYQRGEYVITVGKLPKGKQRGIWVNVALLIATIASTVLAGMDLWASYSGKGVSSFLSLETVLMGALTFALPIMLILGVHEMSHYYAARKHGVAASLPFFIPAPFLFIGTFGAFISIRGPIPDRRSLFDLGVAGPIAGFLAAIPVAIIGSALTTSGAVPVPAETGGALLISMPLIYQALDFFMPVPGNVLMHPMAMAGWVGFLVTAINLLPAGSLDGGHIARAIFGSKYRYASWAAIIVLFALGTFLYTGWLIFALIILLLGTDHAPPLNDITPISSKRKGVSIAIAVILVSCFAIVPMENIAPDYSFEADIEGSNLANISVGANHTFTILIESTGNLDTKLLFDIQPAALRSNLSLDLKYSIGASGENISVENLTATVPVKGNATAYLTIVLSKAIQQTVEINGSILVSATDAPEVNRALPITVLKIAGNYSCTLTPASLTMSGNQTRTIQANVTNNYPHDLPLQVTLIAPGGWSAWAYDDDPANATSRLNFTVNATSNASFTVKISSPFSVTAGDTVVVTMDLLEKDNAEVRVQKIQITTA